VPLSSPWSSSPSFLQRRSAEVEVEAWGTSPGDTLDRRLTTWGAPRCDQWDPGVGLGLQLEETETATTVRLQDGNTRTTDEPFVATTEALRCYLVFDADGLDPIVLKPPGRNGPT
jgi:hypothetical protein